jgi:hypothetical protein
VYLANKRQIAIVALSPQRENFQGKAKAMHIQKSTKLPKRVWKAVVYLDLVDRSRRIALPIAILFLERFYVKFPSAGYRCNSSV